MTRLWVQMTWVRRYLGAVGTALIVGALVSLAVPMHLDAADRHGHSLPCGTALHPDRGIVVAEDQHNGMLHSQNGGSYHRSDYIGECAAWVQHKRRAALWVGSAGAMIIASTQLLIRRRQARRQHVTDPVQAGALRAPSITEQRYVVQPCEHHDDHDEVASVMVNRGWDSEGHR